jgi:hypothetical protein
MILTSIPDALFGPAPEPDIDRVPLAVAFVHVAPGTTNPQHVKHAIEKNTVIVRWPGPAPPAQMAARDRSVPIPHLTSPHGP